MDNGQFNTTEATLPTAVDERLWQRPTGCRKSLQEAQRSRGACLLGNLYCLNIRRLSSSSSSSCFISRGGGGDLVIGVIQGSLNPLWYFVSHPARRCLGFPSPSQVSTVIGTCYRDELKRTHQQLSTLNKSCVVDSYQ
ncbi:unnamed protein product [Fusarium graminearum]|uniref:Uncharacterized protein n=1 Tax=Gibberella zeae TaxID=5518 RepID=A0A9N8WRA0_GIBZA|nr:unnamed protein product [Fusarium graminearum]